MAKFIHCHIRDCSRYFAYLSDGRIVPADELNAQETENAQYTIDLLNLNSGFLQTERRNHWEELEQLLMNTLKKIGICSNYSSLIWFQHQTINCMNSSALHASFSSKKLNRYYRATPQH